MSIQFLFFLDLLQGVYSQQEIVSVDEGGPDIVEYVEESEGSTEAIPNPPFMKLSNGNFACNVCYKHFISYINFKRHFVTHTGEKPFACFKCDRRCTQKVSLRVHCERAHGISKEHFAALYRATGQRNT